MDARCRSTNGVTRRLWHLLQPGRTGDRRRSLFQPAVFQLQSFCAVSRSATCNAAESVSQLVSNRAAEIGDGVPERSADFLARTLEREHTKAARIEPSRRSCVCRL